MKKLDLEELAAILADIRQRPNPVDRRPVGCLLVLLASAAFLFFPTLAQALDLPSLWKSVALVLFGTLSAAGIGLAIFGSGGGYSDALGRVEEALTTLTEAPPRPGLFTSPEFLRAAVAILEAAHHTSGPTTVNTFAPEDVATRLGPALEGVLAIEQILLDADLIYPVFTSSSTES